jgi:hypothetical protein
MYQRDALHGISPYVGRLAAHRASALISDLTKRGSVIADPFCGSGTVPLEAWRAGAEVVAGDLSPYAVAITQAKLNPPANLESALLEIDRLAPKAMKESARVDLRKVPKWVREFYHPETLREAIGWAAILRRQKSKFLFGCFLNLLHHQRPGFLSYPASHATPYLRVSKFPRDRFPEMYSYRDVRTRLEKKVRRTLKTPISLDFDIQRSVRRGHAATLCRKTNSVDCIITSPPYMSGLDYARDNRLRLWFCGVGDWITLEGDLSPGRTAFASLMQRCVTNWQDWIKPGGHVALVLGDIHQNNKRIDVARIMLDSVASCAPRLSLVACEDQVIPDEKRLIKGKTGTITETTLIFGKAKKC